MSGIYCGTHGCGRLATHRALYHRIPAAGLPQSEIWTACAEHATPERAPVSSITIFPPKGGPRHIGGERQAWVSIAPRG